MAYTPTTPFGKLAASKMEPWYTDDLGRYLDSLGVMFDPLIEIAQESGSEGEVGWVPAWSKLLNVKTCPAPYLPYLGMFVGTTLKKNVSGVEAREEIEHEYGFSRGTVGAIEGAIYRTTTLEKTSHTLIERGILFERTKEAEGDAPYHFLVVLEPAQVPSLERLEEALNERKPGGVFYTITLSETLVWAAAPGKWSEATHSWAGATSAP